jgi:flagellar motor switch protein FliG
MALALAAQESEYSGVERAAILLMYLERPLAKALLDRMSDDEVRKVGLAMASIERVDPPVIERIVGEFVRDLYEVSMMPRSGADFVNTVLPELLPGERGEAIMPMLNRRVNTDFEDFISNRPPEAVAAILKDEHPQTQAVALALMGPDNAAQVLRRMDEESKGEVTVRMARLRRIPGELIDDVTNALKSALGKDDDYLELGGVDKTARILGQLVKTENDRILEVVADEDNALAERLRRRMVLFSDLAALTNRGIQTLLKQVDRDDLILALKGAQPHEVDKFLDNVSSRAAEDIREEMEIMGQVPKSRVRGAQERIVATALKLAEEGAIYMAIGADDEEEGGES